MDRLIVWHTSALCSWLTAASLTDHRLAAHQEQPGNLKENLKYLLLLRRSLITREKYYVVFLQVFFRCPRCLACESMFFTVLPRPVVARLSLSLRLRLLLYTLHCCSFGLLCTLCTCLVFGYPDVLLSIYMLLNYLTCDSLCVSRWSFHTHH